MMMIILMMMMMNQNYIIQGAMKRLAFPAEAQECIWRVGVAHISHFNEKISFGFVHLLSISTGACLSPPPWEHPLQCSRQGGDGGDYHCHAQDYDQYHKYDQKHGSS